MQSSQDIRPFVDHLFRHESGKMVAVLTRIFGPHNLELAEDVVQDTLIKALENWKINGLPQNPSAWLFTAARNKALDVIRKERHHKDFAKEISPLLKSAYTAGETIKQFVNESEIEDEQLRMMFACCHPSLAEEAQIAMILKTLCGFSVAEIARAFLTNEETISKRLYRARQQFRDEKIAFAIPGPNEIHQRLNNVLVAVYLIFNEGYNSTHHASLVREDLIEESLRLGKMLVDHPITRQTDSLALLALLCFHSARLSGRLDEGGNLLQLHEQNRSLWNSELIQQGANYLREASKGETVSPFHLEAAIAYEHCSAKRMEDTDWKTILQLYDWLYQIKPNAMVALNRLIAFGEVKGAKAALIEAEKMKPTGSLEDHYLFFATLGGWHWQEGEQEKALVCLERALQLTQSPTEKNLLEKKIEMVRSGQQVADAKK